jgi:predicted dehydrogenase
MRLSPTVCGWQNSLVAAANKPQRTSDGPRVAVIGTGSLGKEHARIYAEMAAGGGVEFAGVFDTNTEVARSYASKYNVRAFRSVEEAADFADALNVVTPTTTHFSIARELLRRGKHLLVEKPMTVDSDQAAELVRLSHEHRCLLQVGHVERFNPVFKYWRASRPIRASLRRIGFRLTRRGARTSE